MSNSITLLTKSFAGFTGGAIRCLERAKELPILTIEEEQALYPLVKRGDADAIKELILRYSAMVKMFVGKYYYLPECNREEMIQDVFVRLLSATKKWDIERGRFAQIAAIEIRTAIFEYHMCNMHIVRFPSGKAVRTAYRGIKSLARRRNGMQQLTTDEVVEIANMASSDAMRPSSAVINDVATILLSRSITEYTHADGGVEDVYSTISGPSELEPENHYKTHIRLQIEDALWDPAVLRQCLDEREMDIFINRTMQPFTSQRTLGDLGKQYSVSAERVRQVELEVVRKVTKMIRNMFNVEEACDA